MASTGQNTEQARQAQDVDAIPTLVWSARPDGSAEFFNRRWTPEDHRHDPDTRMVYFAGWYGNILEPAMARIYGLIS